MKNIIENVKIGLEMLIIGTILLYIGTVIFMPSMTIKIFSFQPYIVSTESMEPVINVNDMVVITPFNIDDANVGDIITFYADIDYNGTQEIVTHYIYSIDDSGETTVIRTHRYFNEGDTIIPDTWIIPADEVIGTYGFQVPYVGYIVGFIKSLYGIAIITINVIIFAVIKFVKTKEVKSNSEENLADVDVNKVEIQVE